MRIGIIDLGTNSVRFDVREIGAGGEVTPLYRDKVMVRLGQNAFSSKKLNPRAVQRTLQAFVKFKRIAMKYRLAKVLAFGTAALREVSDREKFIALIRERTGFEIRVISGAEEARLIALGILSNEVLPKGRYALIDIGGGSTEISICRGKKVLHSESFPLGVARLQEMHLKTFPPEPRRLIALRRYIQSVLAKKMEAENWPRARTVIGSSGTIRAIVKIEKRFYGDDELRPEYVADLVDMLSELDLKRLRSFPGLDKKRADLILAGAVVFEECMLALGAETGQVSQFSLRDGIVEEEIRLSRQGNYSHLSLHLNDLYALAVSFGRNEAHLKRSAALAETLFEKLKSVHRLTPDWMIYLVTATILRNIGEAVSIARHPLHTYYLLKNADLPPMEEWEADLISRLCLLHEGDKPIKKQTVSQMKDVPWPVFQKLLALLRLVDAFDSGPQSVVKIKQARRRGKVVKIEYSGQRLTGLESVNVDERATSLRSALKMKVIAERVK